MRIRGHEINSDADVCTLAGLGTGFALQHLPDDTQFLAMLTGRDRLMSSVFSISFEDDGDPSFADEMSMFDMLLDMSKESDDPEVFLVRGISTRADEESMAILVVMLGAAGYDLTGHAQVWVDGQAVTITGEVIHPPAMV